MIHFTCPKCGDFISVPDSSAGQSTSCPRCRNVSVVPQPQASAPPAPPGPPAAAAGAPAALPPRKTLDEPQARTWGMLCHLTALSGFVGVPFGHIVGPLVCWLVKGKEHPFVDSQGKEALNFQISFSIYGLVAFVLVFALIGIVLLPAVAIVDIVLTIIAAVKANNGESYRYPLCIRFIK